MLGWIVLCIIIVLIAAVGFRNANHNYTFGSGLFKRSEANLEKNKYLDPADYQYYNSKDKLK